MIPISDEEWTEKKWDSPRSIAFFRQLGEQFKRRMEMREDFQDLKGNSAQKELGPQVGAGRPMSDTELAAQYKHDMTLALQAVTLIMDRARAQGLIVGFVNIGMTQSGKYEAGGITVARYF